MRILLVEPGKTPVLKEIDGSLKSMQEIVGGTIQVLYPFAEPVALVCNDEGKLLGLPLNRALRDENGRIYDIVAGTFFLCGAPKGSDRFESLIEDQHLNFYKHFKKAELFLNLDGNLCCIQLN
ncbi:MAG: hypothetical protein DBX91_09155 [Subdoligranulum variabile]|nr:MAG: hypothetical protein DBX91_09155 [Subdoligranulum variabile]